MDTKTSKEDVDGANTGTGMQEGEVEVKTKKKWNIKIPFFALMFSYIAASVFIVGVIGWKFTLDSANASLYDLANKIQVRAVTQINNTIVQSAQIVSHVTRLQTELFNVRLLSSFQSIEIMKANSMSFLGSKQADAMKSMLYVLRRFRTWSIGVVARLQNGDLFEYYYPVDDTDNTLRLRKIVNAAESTFLCDPDGNSLTQSTSEDPLAEPSFASLLMARGFSKAYAWRNGAYLRSISQGFNSITLETAIFGVDWPMEKIGKRIAKIIERYKYSMFVAMLEINSGNIVLTTDNSTVATANNFKAIYDIGRFFGADINDWILSRSQLLSEGISTVAKDLSGGNDIVSRRTVDGQNYLLRTSRLPFSQQFNFTSDWILFVYLNLDEVNSKLKGDYDKTEIIVFSIMGGVVVLGTLFAFFMSRQIKLVVRQIVTLKDLKFQEVLTHEKSMKRTSFVLELADLQHSFCEMVLTFAAHLKFSGAIQTPSASDDELPPEDLPLPNDPYVQNS
ncbi:hypothetical protein HDU97_002867 [Phlyctochytrium planicorne]|nr:hypothetical protein HDU97_002867 [Phlyctochytrium planicorne]